MTRTVTKLRTRSAKLSGKIKELYKEGKCRDCSVSVTQMDFAKILGNFSKVKVVFENGELSPGNKSKDSPKVSERSTRHNTRLTSNENGMVLIPRSAYKSHPVKTPSKSVPTRSKQPVVREKNTSPPKRDRNSNYNNLKKNNRKVYRLKFVNRIMQKDNLPTADVKFADLILNFNTTILPSEDWIVDYLPKDSELKKVYDRVEAELADLMNNEPTEKVEQKKPVTEAKPTAMDESENTTVSGKSLPILEGEDNLIEVTPNEVKSEVCEPKVEDVAADANSIKAPENEQPMEKTEQQMDTTEQQMDTTEQQSETKSEIKQKENSNADGNSELLTSLLRLDNVDMKGLSELTFKYLKDSNTKVVRYFRNLKYKIEIGGKEVTLVGAPNTVTSSEDLKALLEIVDQCNGECFFLEQ